MVKSYILDWNQVEILLNQHKTKEIDYQKRRKKIFTQKKIKNKKNRIEQKIK